MISFGGLGLVDDEHEGTDDVVGEAIGIAQRPLSLKLDRDELEPGNGRYGAQALDNCSGNGFGFREADLAGPDMHIGKDFPAITARISIGDDLLLADCDARKRIASRNDVEDIPARDGRGFFQRVEDGLLDLRVDHPPAATLRAALPRDRLILP